MNRWVGEWKTYEEDEVGDGWVELPLEFALVFVCDDLDEVTEGGEVGVGVDDRLVDLQTLFWGRWVGGWVGGWVIGR